MSIPRVGILLRYFNNDINDVEYLCVYQSASRFWGFPKGRINEFESYTNGACREMYEETGVKIYPFELSFNNFYHIKRGKHHHYYFVKDIIDKPIVTVDNDEILDYKWMILKELSNENISYFTEQLIKKINEPYYVKK